MTKKPKLLKNELDMIFSKFQYIIKTYKLHMWTKAFFIHFSLHLWLNNIYGIYNIFSYWLTTCSAMGRNQVLIVMELPHGLFLTQDLVRHICVSELDHYWFRWRLRASEVPSQYWLNDGLLSIGPLESNSVTFEPKYTRITKIALLQNCCHFNPALMC